VVGTIVQTAVVWKKRHQGKEAFCDNPNTVLPANGLTCGADGMEILAMELTSIEYSDHFSENECCTLNFEKDYSNKEIRR
jgi:hypothetical protein